MRISFTEKRDHLDRRTDQPIFGEWISNYFDQIPAFHRWVVYFSSIMYLLSIFSDRIKDWFALKNQMNLSLSYKIIISTFVVDDAFEFFLVFTLWLNETSVTEKERGTFPYAIDFIISILIINCITILLLSLSSFLFPDLDLYSIGMWPIVFKEIICITRRFPNHKVCFYFFPYKFRALYYPYILFLFLLVIKAFHLDLSIISGIIFGFIYFWKIGEFNFPTLASRIESFYIKRVNGEIQPDDDDYFYRMRRESINRIRYIVSQ